MKLEISSKKAGRTEFWRRKWKGGEESFAYSALHLLHVIRCLKHFRCSWKWRVQGSRPVDCGNKEMRLGRCQFAPWHFQFAFDSVCTSESSNFITVLTLVTVFTTIFTASVVNMVPVITSFTIGYDACRLDSGFSVARTCPFHTFVTFLLLI